MHWSILVLEITFLQIFKRLHVEIFKFRTRLLLGKGFQTNKSLKQILKNAFSHNLYHPKINSVVI